MNTVEDNVEQFIALALRTGRVYVAEDVYDLLRSGSEYEKLRHLQICGGVEIVSSPYLPPGSILAVDATVFVNRYMDISV